MFKLLFSLLLLIASLHATTISSQKETYAVGELLNFTATEMSGDSTDWIGVYPIGASNAWENVVAWKWTRWNAPQTEGTLTLSGISAGEYEVRAFFHNSYQVEATDTFKVIASNNETSIDVQKESYEPHESITITLKNMSGDTQDWIGIYPVGSSNSWDNVVSWKWTGGIIDGSITLTGVAAGNYEARAFFKNSYHLETIDTFSVTEVIQEAPVSISTSKEIYTPYEAITISLSHMLGDTKDWIGIYPVGSSNSWDNVVSWKWTGGIIDGNITLTGVPAGNYEARAFFENSYHLETIDTFIVEANQQIQTEAKIFIIGDSTVHNTSEGEMGWGSKLGEYLKKSEDVFNRARSGSSSKSYKLASSTHHDWDYTKTLISQTDITEGAYLLIQFGHNDEKDGSLHTEPGRYNSYYNELKVYLDEARDMGVTPVLITPVSRQYKGSRTHGEYPQTMKDLAEDEGIVLLDLEYKSYLEFNKYESDAAIQAVFSYDDGTHFNPTGAGIVAGWVKELACSSTDQTLCSQFQ